MHGSIDRVRGGGHPVVSTEPAAAADRPSALAPVDRPWRAGTTGRMARPRRGGLGSPGAVVLVVVLMVGLVGGCFRPSPTELQRRWADQLRPARFDVESAPPVAIRTLKVRVHADEGHRSALLGWQVRFYDLVERVNPALRRAIGAELEILSVGDWKRSTNAGGDLLGALTDLQRHDPGDDVDLVVGLTTPLPTVSMVHSDLGMAYLLGRHIVLRPGDDLQEFQAFERSLDRLSEEERERLYLQRRRHRSALSFLHEIGHALGALHANEPTAIMAPRVHPKAAAFTQENLQLMRAGLALRDQPLGEVDDSAYRAALEASDDRAFAPEARARMLALVAGGRRSLARTTELDVHPPELGPSGQYEGTSDAELTRRAGAIADESPEAAWAMLEPIVRRNPDDAEVHRVACEVSYRRHDASDETLAWCRRAVELAPSVLEPLLLRGAVHQRRGERREALADAQAAERLLMQSKPDSAAAWTNVARLYQSLSSVTWAERAAERADDPELVREMRDWSRKIRRTYRLPENAAERGVPPAAESGYVALRAELAAAAGRGDVRGVQKLQERLRQKYPKLAVSPAACRVLVDRRQWAEAWPRCRVAARRLPKSADAQTLAAVAAFGAGRPREAIGPLQRALRLAPERKDAWRLLATAYRLTGRAQALRQLERRYDRRFGEPLD